MHKVIGLQSLAVQPIKRLVTILQLAVAITILPMGNTHLSAVEIHGLLMANSTGGLVHYGKTIELTLSERLKSRQSLTTAETGKLVGEIILP